MQLKSGETVTARSLELDGSRSHALKGKLEIIHVEAGDLTPAFTAYFVDGQEADENSIRPAKEEKPEFQLKDYIKEFYAYFAKRPPGNPDALREYWETGPGGEKIGWGNPEEGDLTRCYDYLIKYMTSEEAWGFCQERKMAVSGMSNAEADAKGKKSELAARLETFINTCHDPSNGRFCETHGTTHKTKMVPASSAVSGQMPRKEVGIEVRKAFAVMEEIGIQVPENIAKIPIKTKRNIKHQAAYAYYENGDDEVPVSIEINPDRSQHLGLSFVHEFGHYLDSQVFGRVTRKSADPKVEAVKKAIKESAAYDRLLNPNDERPIAKQRAAYYTSMTESFARAFAQYVAQKSGDPTLVSEVNGVISHPNPNAEVYRNSQWGKTDFQPILTAMDDLLRSRGMLKR